MISIETMKYRMANSSLTGNLSVIRECIIKSFADAGNDEKAAERAFDILYKTRLGALVDGYWEKVEITDFTNTKNIQSIITNMKSCENYFYGALREIKSHIPVETIDLLKEFFVTQSPTYRVACLVMVVALEVLKDA